MNKIIFTLAAVMAMCLAACAQNDKGEKSMGNESKPLVVYFSATGTTARAARTIAEATGGTLREIAPRQAYTAATWLWIGMFAARLLVQVPLYLAGEVALLGVARLVMGVPLWGLVLWLTWLLVRGVRPHAPSGAASSS